MKKTRLALTLAASAIAGISMAQAPAFPGAEGHGRYTTGGRGGKVIHVTNLNDSGEGSLREAVSGNDKKIVVFDVGGVIELERNLNIGGNTTILGQTAPGQGITLRYYTIEYNGDNIIVRFVRFRRGQERDVNDGADATWTRHHRNIMLDHCSFSWSIDEVASFYDNRDFTMQWCTVAEALNNAGHKKGAHGYGGIWGGKGASFHHNFLAHLNNRSPRFNGARYAWDGYDQDEYDNTVMAERVDFRNCLIYNWGTGGCYGGEGMNVNIVNNYYKPGPATENRSETIQRRIAGIGIRTSEYTGHNTDSPNEWDKMWHVWGKFYVDGNVNSKYDDVTNDNWTYGMYNQITNGSGVDNTYTQATRDTMRINEPIDFVAVTTHSAADAFDRVLKYAGCRRTESSRDALDIILVNDAREGLATFTGRNCDQGFINSQDDCGGWPVLATANAPADLDNDGISDQWEDFNGLDPSNPDDGNEVGADGYTNLERYLNSLVNITTINQNAGGTQMGYIIYEDGTTSITGIEDTNASQYGANATADNNIYFLNGTIAKQNATMEDYDSLAKGIYIHKGKKVVVK